MVFLIANTDFSEFYALKEYSPHSNAEFNHTRILRLKNLQQKMSTLTGKTYLHKILHLEVQENHLYELSHVGNSDLKQRLLDKRHTNLVLNKLQNVDLLENKIETIYRLFKQSLLAIETLHSIGFVHTDLKPSNIITFNKIISELAIVDYGMVHRIGVLEGFLNKTVYSPPEQQVYITALAEPAVDYYSLGKTWMAVISLLDHELYEKTKVARDQDKTIEQFEIFKEIHIAEIKRKVSERSWLQLKSLLVFIDSALEFYPQDRIKSLVKNRGKIFGPSDPSPSLLKMNMCKFIFSGY